MSYDNESLVTDPELLKEEQDGEEQDREEKCEKYRKKIKVFVASKTDIEGRISRYMQRHGMGIQSIQYIGSNTYAVVLAETNQQNVYVFDTYDEFAEKKEDKSWMLSVDVGDVVYIVQQGIPDYWYAGEGHGEGGWCEMETDGYSQEQIKDILTNEEGGITFDTKKLKVTHSGTPQESAVLNNKPYIVGFDTWGHVNQYRVATDEDFKGIGVVSNKQVSEAFSSSAFPALNTSAGTNVSQIIERVNKIVETLRDFHTTTVPEEDTPVEENP